MSGDLFIFKQKQNKFNKQNCRKQSTQNIKQPVLRIDKNPSRLSNIPLYR
jgi:hypothetical protein